MKSATHAILQLKKSPAVQIEPVQSDRFFLGLATCLLFCWWCSYVPNKTKPIEWQQDSIKYWKLKNAMINVGIEDIIEVTEGVSEIRQLDHSVEIRHR